MSQKIILYGHPGCPTVPLIRAILKQAGAEFDDVNIRADESARRHLREINQGYESVPTLVFPDGSTLTEPSSSELRNILEALGYESQPPARIRAFENLLRRISGQLL